jgi:pimeloyl-ACP methyl ester carboxylesterase
MTPALLLTLLVASAPVIQSREAYVTREGLRIYLWEKFRPDQEPDFARTGRVALLVHGGGRSGRPAFDLQVRDYSLMDFLATHGYDVWAIDIHGYGRSDKTDKDWSDTYSAAADIAAAVAHITGARGVARINLLGWSAGTPPNVFVEWANLPILDPARITVPTMIIHGEEDYAATEEDLLPFYAQLGTHDKRYVLLPNAGHLVMLEKDHRRFQHEVLSFFDRP